MIKGFKLLILLLSLSFPFTACSQDISMSDSLTNTVSDTVSTIDGDTLGENLKESFFGKIKIHGVITDYITEEKRAVVKVTLYKDGIKESVVITDVDGGYMFMTELGHVYLLKYSKKGLVTKSVEVDTRNVSSEDQEYGYDMLIDMTLFESDPKVDLSILDAPIGKAKYDISTGDIKWDYEYTTNIQSQIKAINLKIERKKSRFEKKKK